MSEYPIGHEVEHAGKKFRVVRIIGNSVALFEDEKKAYLQTESYVQLKAIDGTIDFVTFTIERAPYEGPNSLIKALEPINAGGVA